MTSQSRSASVEPPGITRRLPLQGAVNFRDLGGYPTQDGRRLKAGLLFRSDQLADLSDADVDHLSMLGLRTICDLRGWAERDQRPNRKLRGPVPSVHAIGFMPEGAEALLEDARAATLSVADVECRVSEMYRSFVTKEIAAFSSLLRLLETEDLPLLFHCTSGRDRTGFAAAVILMALGVPRSVIEEDYALSNAYRRDLTFQVGGPVEPALMAALTHANPAYLAGAYLAIEERWGDTEAYLHRGLGMDAARLQSLRNRLLG